MFFSHFSLCNFLKENRVFSHCSLFYFYCYFCFNRLIILFCAAAVVLKRQNCPASQFKQYFTFLFHLYDRSLHKATCKKLSPTDSENYANVQIHESLKGTVAYHIWYETPMVFHHNYFELILVDPQFTNQKPVLHAELFENNLINDQNLKLHQKVIDYNKTEYKSSRTTGC